MIGSKSKHVAIHGDTCSSSQGKIPYFRCNASFIFSFFPWLRDLGVSLLGANLLRATQAG